MNICAATSPAAAPLQCEQAMVKLFLIVIPHDLPQVESQYRFGRPGPGTFSGQCVKTGNEDDGLFGIPIRARRIMRMQPDAELPASA